MNSLLEKVFANRGYDADFLRNIEVSDHADLMDVDKLCQRLYDIQCNGRKIVILPDFDMDGIMSGVIGFAGLAEMGFNVALFIPNPTDGYEFDKRVIDRLVNEHPDVSAIITCDVGTQCYEGIAYAKQLGIEVLVTDHHKQDASKASQLKSDCIVNPMRCDETYKHPGICGAYVLYQCLCYYAHMYTNNQMVDQIHRLRVFAGIGTISDSMPLLYENRQLVRDSISMLKLLYSRGNSWFVDLIQGNPVYRGAFVGLYKILCTFASIGKITNDSDITESFIGYYFAPMFNAVKRMDGDMSKAFGVFFTNDSDECLDYLVALNDERKLTVQSYYDDLVNNFDKQKFAPYIYVTDASLGILGLLATQLMNMSGVPTVVVRKCDDGIYRGSGRAPSWYPMMSRCENSGFYVAGHEAAFGVGVTDKRELKAFAAFLRNDISYVMSTINMDDYESKPDLLIATDGSGDTGIDIPLFAEYLRELEQYRPFGSHFPEPVIKFTFSPDECKWSVIGSTKQHLKLEFARGFYVLCWNQAANKAYYESQPVCSVVGKLGLNVFNEMYSVNFIGDLR